MINFASMRTLLQTCVDYDCSVQFSYSPHSLDCLQIEFRWTETLAFQKMYYYWHIDLMQLSQMPLPDAWIKTESERILRECITKRREGKVYMPRKGAVD